MSVIVTAVRRLEDRRIDAVLGRAFTHAASCTGRCDQ